MRAFYTLIVLSFFTINVTISQNYQSGAITTNDQQTVEGRVAIDNHSKKVLFKKSLESKTYSFSSINNIRIGNKNYSKITFNNEEYLVNSITSGKASLYSLTNDNFLITNKNDKGQTFNLIHDKHQIPGILSLIFYDCNSVRDEINKTAEFSVNTLSRLTNLYNNCDYGTFTPTETEISRANIYNTDSYRFYGAFLSSFNTTIVNNFDSKNTNGFGLGIGIASSPSFMGNLKGNIYIDLDFSMIFTGGNKFNNGNTTLNYKVNNYRLSLGVEYVFNKKGIFSPFLGIGVGLTSDYYNGTLGSTNFKDNDQNYYYTPKAGILYKLKNKNHLGLTINYISEYENNLSFYFNEEINPLVINTEFLTIGLSYYF